MCNICCCACSLVRWAVGVGTIIIIIAAFVAGGYILGPVVAKDKKAPPSVYEYYRDGGIVEGLKAEMKDFTLNKKVISLHSGSIHYFRVHPQYWRDRLRKLRAAGFVAVETYVPWNLHEPYDGVFDFGDGGEDMSPFLDIRTFLRIAQEEDLLAILRPGPYICAEWEFGGLPSWLLKDSSIRVRTSDPKYTARVQQYFDRLLPILKNLQFSTGEGPIIAFQIENEYGNTKEPNKTTDKKHLQDIKKMYEDAGLIELLFTSDTPTKGREYGAVEGVLEVANFNEKAVEELTLLKEFQPNKPTMVMEFWTGWFDHWGESHHTMSLKNFRSVLEDILKFPSGVNFYMFHGGTTFGFLSGGNVYSSFPFYLPDISSYDYDAPLSEAGDYTDKYEATIELLAKYQKVALKTPDRPKETTKSAYETLTAPYILDWNSLVSQVEIDDVQKSSQPLYMEFLKANGGSGQNFGYVVYRPSPVQLKLGAQLQISGTINGAAMVVVDNELRSPPLQTIDDLKNFGYWCTETSNNKLDLQVKSPSDASTMDIIIENWSRNNYGKLSTDFNQLRGLSGDQIKLDGGSLTDFTIFSLQFKGKWVRRLTGWKQSPPPVKGPVMLQFKLNVETPADTFVDMQEWGKGIVFINGFNIGRYSSIGPVRTLFAPAPLFNIGMNEICVFEHFSPSDKLKFSERQIFKNADNTFKVDL